MYAEFYQPNPPAGSGKILANLDGVRPDGTVSGWAIYQDSLTVCHMEVRLGSRVLGEDMVDTFRADLLQARLRHGHCAFFIRIDPLPPGPYPLKLFDGRTGKPVRQPDQNYNVPIFTRRVAEPVSLYLTEPHVWHDDHLANGHACLNLDENFALMGAEKFADMIFQFVLGRWADPAGRMHYAGALARGDLTPEAVFLAVLCSEERRLQKRSLPRPMDPDFPFLLRPGTNFAESFLAGIP